MILPLVCSALRALPSTLMHGCSSWRPHAFAAAAARLRQLLEIFADRGQ